MIIVFRKDGRVTRLEVNQEGRNAIYSDYNALMVKYEKAVKYMDNEKVSVEAKLLQLPRLISLLDEISASLILLKSIGEDWEAHKWLK